MTKYEHCKLRYKLDISDDLYFNAEKTYLEMRELLEEVGVWLDVKDDVLYLQISTDKYLKIRNRKAGRHTKKAWKKEASKKHEYYKYSDIVYMMQTMNAQEVSERIGMPIATYYRHKKTMEESEYFKSLDLNRLTDKEYLDSVPYNRCF